MVFENLIKLSDVELINLKVLVESHLEELHECFNYSISSKNDEMKVIFEDDIKRFESILAKLS